MNSPWDSWNAQRYSVHTRRHQELTDLVEYKTTEILKRLGHKGWLKEFDESNVTYEWNDSCHCHPSYREARFPANWIFAENWEQLVDEEKVRQKVVLDAKEKSNREIQEREERERYEKLKVKFG